MYAVEADEVAVQQIDTLPVDALTHSAELVAVLELTPWSGSPYDPDRPNANLRTSSFGSQGEGLAVYSSWTTSAGSSSFA